MGPLHGGRGDSLVPAHTRGSVPLSLFSHERKLSHHTRMNTATSMTCLTIGLHTCNNEPAPAPAPAPALALAPRHATPRPDAPSRSRHTQLRAGAFRTSSECTRPVARAPHPSPLSQLNFQHVRGGISKTMPVISGYKRPKAEVRWGAV